MLQTTRTGCRNLLLMVSVLPIAATCQDGPWKEAMERGNQSRRQGRFREAEREYFEALGNAATCVSPDPCLAVAWNNLGLLYQFQARYKESEELYRKSLAIWTKLDRLDQPEGLATRNNLAILCQVLGQRTQAEKLLLGLLARRQSTLGLDHEDVATTLNDL